MDFLYSWIGWIVFWGAVVIGLVAVIAATAVACGWHFYRYRLVGDKEFDRTQDQLRRLREAHRWFSAFKDLDIIWDYIFYGEDNIALVRSVYAHKRGVTVYNEPLVAAKAPPQCPLWIRPECSDSILACSEDEGHEGPHHTGADGYAEDRFQHMWVDHDTAAAGTSWGAARKDS